MQQIIKNYWDLRNKSKKYGVELKQTRPSFENVFAMIFNNATMVLEVLDNYYRFWNRNYVGLSPQKIQQSKKQNAERVIEITKWSFTHTISSFEYSAKDIIKNTSRQEFQNLKKYPSMKKS